MKAIQPTAIRPIVVFLAGLIAIVISGGALVGWAYENETLKRLSLQFVQIPELTVLSLPSCWHQPPLKTNIQWRRMPRSI